MSLSHLIVVKCFLVLISDIAALMYLISSSNDLCCAFMVVSVNMLSYNLLRCCWKVLYFISDDGGMAAILSELVLVLNVFEIFCRVLIMWWIFSGECWYDSSVPAE